MWPWHTLIWFDAAPARGIAGALQLGFLGGQLQDLHILCELDGPLQAKQHEVMAVVLPWGEGVVLQEAQVEIGVWKVLTDMGKLGCVFVLKQVVATQPELVIAGEGEGGDDENERGGRKGGHEEGSKMRKRNRKGGREGERERDRGKIQSHRKQRDCE